METKAEANNPNRSYTDFEPYCIWHKKEDSDALDVHLNGFQKEQMTVKINKARILTISGQRPLDNDNKKWSRFHKEIKLADNTIDNDVRSKFAGGILSIEMPKKPDILSLSIPLPSDIVQTAQDVWVQLKFEKVTTAAAATQKGNDTVSASENAQLFGMKLGSYFLGQKKSDAGWWLKMDKNMGVKVGVVLVFLLVGFGFYVKCSCRMPFDLCVKEN